MSVAAIIVAAGRGTRAGGGVPKQWRDLAGRSVAARTLEVFRNAPEVDRIVLVLHEADMGLAPGWLDPGRLDVVAGGATRSASVRAGLTALSDTPPAYVLIHDVARPLVDAGLIARVVSALEDHPGAAPGLTVTDALWRVEAGQVVGTVDRTGLARAQTPQGFHYAALTEAYAAFAGDAADDVEVARAAGLEVAIVPGDEANLKITTAEDFGRAERLMRANMNIRMGNGFDVHAFGPGDAVILCGVRIPHVAGLVGHSDADVGLHAVTDAIYGALAEGDIGTHFPPSDPQWKGADSAVFLAHAVELARDRGLSPGNIDLTLICEEPKIGPHATAMRMELSHILEVDPGVVSVKATTSERLGFTGRREGIAALATAVLVPL
ncbi:MAG: bifunctional 2-C-methyl-D-erythritol 4-phosphate cytidylyltransferase/2-C-methyl-D-erythritol 2,4-cyclodiphosphate synthase [Pseudomonadota bacterium]